MSQKFSRAKEAFLEMLNTPELGMWSNKNLYLNKIKDAVNIDASLITLMAKEDEIENKGADEVGVGVRMPFPCIIMKMDFTTSENKDLYKSDWNHHYAIMFEISMNDVGNTKDLGFDIANNYNGTLIVAFMYSPAYDKVIPIMLLSPVDSDGNCYPIKDKQYLGAIISKDNGLADKIINETQNFIGNFGAWTLYHLSVINCNNVELKKSENILLKPGCSKKARKRFINNSYYIIEIDGLKKGYYTDFKNTGIHHRYHRCRGHFKVVDNLFGKGIRGRLWWKSHVRGDRKLGEITKDYVVSQQHCDYVAEGKRSI